MGVNIKMTNGDEYYVPHVNTDEIIERIQNVGFDDGYLDLEEVHQGTQTITRYRVQVITKHISSLEERIQD